MDPEVALALMCWGIDIQVMNDRERYLLEQAFRAGHQEGWMAGNSETDPDAYYEY